MSDTLFIKNFDKALRMQGILLAVISAEFKGKWTSRTKKTFKTLHDGLSDALDAVGLVASMSVGPMAKVLTPEELDHLSSALFGLTSELIELALFGNEVDCGVRAVPTESEAVRLIAKVQRAVSEVKTAIHYHDKLRQQWLRVFVDPRHPLTLNGRTNQWRKMLTSHASVLGASYENELSTARINWLRTVNGLAEWIDDVTLRIRPLAASRFERYAQPTFDYPAEKLERIRNALDLGILPSKDLMDEAYGRTYGSKAFARACEANAFANGQSQSVEPANEDAIDANGCSNAPRDADSQSKAPTKADLNCCVDLGKAFTTEELALLKSQGVDEAQTFVLGVFGLEGCSEETRAAFESAAMKWQKDRIDALRQSEMPRLQKAQRLEADKQMLLTQIQSLSPEQRKLLRNLLDDTH